MNNGSKDRQATQPDKSSVQASSSVSPIKISPFVATLAKIDFSMDKGPSSPSKQEYFEDTNGYQVK
jgi:hypothetical protein